MPPALDFFVEHTSLLLAGWHGGNQHWPALNGPAVEIKVRRHYLSRSQPLFRGSGPSNIWHLRRKGALVGSGTKQDQTLPLTRCTEEVDAFLYCGQSTVELGTAAHWSARGPQCSWKYSIEEDACGYSCGGGWCHKSKAFVPPFVGHQAPL